MVDARLQMRVIWLGSTTGSLEQYRYCRENGWGGKWESTPYKAWLSWRAALRTS